VNFVQNSVQDFGGFTHEQRTGEIFLWLAGNNQRGRALLKKRRPDEKRRLLKGSELQPDIRRMIRLIDEELVARAELFALEEKHRRK